MTEIKKAIDIDTFKQMSEKEIEIEVKRCLDGKSVGTRTMDTIIKLRYGSSIVDVFTITRHRIYEKTD